MEAVKSALKLWYTCVQRAFFKKITKLQLLSREKKVGRVLILAVSYQQDTRVYSPVPNERNLKSVNTRLKD